LATIMPASRAGADPAPARDRDAGANPHPFGPRTWRSGRWPGRPGQPGPGHGRPWRRGSPGMSPARV